MSALPFLALLALTAEPSGRLTLVLELDAGHGVTPALAHTVSEAVLADIRQVASGRILGANDLRSLLSFQRQRTLLGCKDDTGCYAEIGAALGAKEIVTGSLSTVGDTYLLVLRRVDVSHTQVLAEGTRTRKISDEAGLLTDLSALASQLFPPRPAAPSAGVASPAVAAQPAATQPNPVQDLRTSYRAGCDQASGEACYNLGTLIYGDDPAAAAAVFRRGCGLGAPLGCFRAGFIYLTGAKGLSRDPAQGLALLQQACDASTGKGAEGKALDGACLAVSSYYLNGIGVPADPPRAMALLRRVCDRGNDDACARVASAEIHGPAAIRNPEHGKALSKQLCDQGQSGACSDAK